MMQITYIKQYIQVYFRWMDDTFILFLDTNKEVENKVHHLI